jgi:hypothetical protein
MRYWLLPGLVPLSGRCRGCASTAPPPDGHGAEITVGGPDTLQFEPTAISVATADLVRITFVNDGQAPHDIKIEQGEPGKFVLHAEPGRARAG